MLACDGLLTSVFFAPNQIRTCCKRVHVDGVVKGDAVLLDTKDLGSDPVADILLAKENLLSEINSSLFDHVHQCHGCPWLKQYDSNVKPQPVLSHLSFELHSICNMRCTYCSEVYYGGLSPDYDVDTLIHGLTSYFQDMSFSPSIVFGGGEPVIFNDFDKILDFTLLVKPSHFRIFTNSVIFNSRVKTLLDGGDVYITTSIDAGTEETFSVIRGLNAFHRVFSNLSAYCSTTPENVTIKYIFTDGNSDIREICGFLDAISHYNLKPCSFQISSDFKSDELSCVQVESINKLRSGLKDLGVQNLFIDDHLAPRLIASSVDVNEGIPVEPYIVWGCGEHATRIFERIGLSNVLFFVDSSLQCDGEFLGRPSHNPSVLLNEDYLKYRIYIASTQAFPEIKKQLHQLNSNFLVLDTPW